MNYVIVVLFGTILVMIFLYYLVKNHCVNKISKAMKNNDFQEVIHLSEGTFMNRILTSYICDLYKVRAYSFLKDKVKFKEVLDEVLEKDYSIEKQKEFLELYLHYFMLIDDREYAEKLLLKLHDIENPSDFSMHEQAFEVMMNKRTDLIDVMDEQVNSKKYSGFTLGVIVYMIAMQYLYLGDDDKACSYFYNCLSCFHPSAVYVDVAKKHVKELSKKLNREVPNY